MLYVCKSRTHNQLFVPVVQDLHLTFNFFEVTMKSISPNVMEMISVISCNTINAGIEYSSTYWIAVT